MLSLNRPICLLFGGNKLNAGVERRFHEWGCDVVVVDWNEAPSLHGELHLRLDVKTPGPIVAALKERCLLNRVKTGFTSIDVAVPSLAAVLEVCGLKVNSVDGLANCFSKSRQTAIWSERGLLNRESFRVSRSQCLKVSECPRLEKFIGENGVLRKIIVKPDNAASSRGITILEPGSSLDEVKVALAKAFDDASDDLAVIEEFVEGTEFTVEMLGDGAGHVAVYAISKKAHTKNTDRNRIAVKLHYNAISNELAQRIAEVGMECYKALGFCNCLGHLEVLLKADGTISPVEIGARSSGFIASDLVDIASGRSFLRDLYEVQQGGTVPDGLRPQSDKSSMYFFYDIPGGTTIKHACSLLDFCDKAIISHASDTAGLTVGRHIENIDNDNARLGMEVLEGPKVLMTEAYIATAEQRMLTAMLGS